jgi:hypothetical protein
MTFVSTVTFVVAHQARRGSSCSGSKLGRWASGQRSVCQGLLLGPTFVVGLGECRAHFSRNTKTRDDKISTCAVSLGADSKPRV